ncbi:metallophosphoesterase [Candidatus Berkiella aquae]|uniref:Calcineurin-like phosphoesterase n=1 Tax=Candidatus Berkiella aquae TaxID=295108 RepID=A0A0Q9YL96_9GAMM|nr:metallophosphoesterase [Candidatus Berkiella aquae]MCS5711461.1 metallophosphoesterase [Candidatus Berkiella aquae]
MKLAWLTDPHLNFLDPKRRLQFYQTLPNDIDAIAISGDIAEANVLSLILHEMGDSFKKPIYFVLGNHDYYRGQIVEVRELVGLLTNNHPLLFWLNACDPITLDNEVLLVGVDGWADGRYGDYVNSYAVINDSRMITELFQQKILGRFQLLEKMQQLADEDAHGLYEKLCVAAKQNPRKIIVITHVPPFKEAARHEGKVSSDDYLPFFSSKVTGEVLTRFAIENPAIDILTLCGHTHDGCTYQALDNLTVRVGKAEYNQPYVQGTIDSETLVFMPK